MRLSERGPSLRPLGLQGQSFPVPRHGLICVALLIGQEPSSKGAMGLGEHGVVSESEAGQIGCVLGTFPPDGRPRPLESGQSQEGIESHRPLVEVQCGAEASIAVGPVPLDPERHGRRAPIRDGREIDGAARVHERR